jgi:malonyl-CoA/methylmalonyl-CoA synthetase
MQRKIVQRHGATEFGAVFKVHPDDTDIPDGSVGEKASSIDLKLSEGDEGEVLVKSLASWFSCYLNYIGLIQLPSVHVLKISLRSRGNGKSP